MCVDHYLIVGGPADAVQEVVHGVLVVVVAAARDDGAYVAALDHRIVVVFHELVGAV